MNAKFKFSILGIAVILSQFSILAQGTFQPAPQWTFIVPPGFENREGESGINVPDAYMQEVVSPAAFPTLPAGGGVLTGMRFRLDAGSGPGIASYSRFEIALSSNPQPVSRQFFVPGLDRKIVFSAPVRFDLPLAQPAPAPFLIEFPFRDSFLFTPGTSLLIEFRPEGAMPEFGGFTGDYAKSSTLLFVNPTSGGPAFDNGGLVIEFQYKAVPEPSLFCIIITISILMCRRSTQGKDR